MNSLFLALLWALWCAVHSLLIWPGVKSKLGAVWSKGMRFYRLLYNLLAAVTMLPLVYWGMTINGADIHPWHGPWRVVRAGLFCLAVWLFWAGSRNYDGLAMLGLRQIKHGDQCEEADHHCRLETGGILGVIRHPWYAGGLLLIWARDFNSGQLASNVVLSTYLVVGAWIEEKKLEARFGDDYRHYRNQVSAFIPLKWISARKNNQE